MYSCGSSFDVALSRDVNHLESELPLDDGLAGFCHAVVDDGCPQDLVFGSEEIKCAAQGLLGGQYGHGEARQEAVGCGAGFHHEFQEHSFLHGAEGIDAQ